MSISRPSGSVKGTVFRECQRQSLSLSLSRTQPIRLFVYLFSIHPTNTVLYLYDSFLPFICKLPLLLHPNHPRVKYNNAFRL